MHFSNAYSEEEARKSWYPQQRRIFTQILFFLVDGPGRKWLGGGECLLQEHRCSAEHERGEDEDEHPARLRAGKAEWIFVPDFFWIMNLLSRTLRSLRDDGMSLCLVRTCAFSL